MAFLLHLWFKKHTEGRGTTVSLSFLAEGRGTTVLSVETFHFQSSGDRRAAAMVFIGWEEGKRTMVPVDKIPSWLLKTQDSPGFQRQGIEKFEGWLRIQHVHPEWHQVKLAMFRWEFTIYGDRWTIYKHANDYEQDWQTHQKFMHHINGPSHQAYVDDLQWFTIDHADPEFKDAVIHTVDGWRSPFDPEQYNWLLPHGILLLEPHKQWKKMLAYVITQTWKPQLGPRLYRPLVSRNKGPGSIALEVAAKEEDEEPYGYGASSSTTAQATANIPWWQNTRTHDAWTADEGSNFDVQVADDTTSQLSGLPGPTPWSISTAKVYTSPWQESSQTPNRSCATNSVTQSGEGRGYYQQDDPWAHHDGGITAAYPQKSQQPDQAPQEDETMEPARQDTAHLATMAGQHRTSGAAVPTLPLHQLHPQPSLLSQLAGHQPPTDDPMEVDRDAGQGRRKQAPSTPTDAQVTDVDEAGSEAPTQCTPNYTVLPPEEREGMWRNGRFRGRVPTLPPPRTAQPPPGLDAAAPPGYSPMPSAVHTAAFPMNRHLETQQNILRALYEEFRVTSAKADRAREAERLAKQRFEDALLTAPKPGVVDQTWIDSYISSLHADV